MNTSTCSKQQRDPQGLRHSASHPTRPPRRCTWRPPPRINLVSDALTWPAPTGPATPRVRASDCLRTDRGVVRAHVRAVHTHTGIMFFFSFQNPRHGSPTHWPLTHKQFRFTGGWGPSMRAPHVMVKRPVSESRSGVRTVERLFVNRVEGAI